jgi:hypothetical protein
LVLYHGNGDGTFGVHETIAAGHILGTQTADVNRDGTDDLVAVRITSGARDEVPLTKVLSVFLNKPRVFIQTLNTSERLAPGTTRMIRWQHTLPRVTRFRVDVSADGGATWQIVSNDVGTRGGTGAIEWRVTTPSTKLGLVRVTALDATSAADVSNAFFEVSDPFLRFTTVGDGQDWGLGTERRIGWVHNLGTAERVHLDLTRDDGATWTRLVSDLLLRGTLSSAYHWRVVGPPTKQARLRVQWANDAAISSISPRFSISEPMLRLVWPLAGTTVHGCSHFRPQWRHNLGTLETVRLDLSLDGGQTWDSMARLRNSGVSRASYTQYEFVEAPTDRAFFRVLWERNPAAQSVSGPLRITADPYYPYCD